MTTKLGLLILINLVICEGSSWQDQYFDEQENNFKQIPRSIKNDNIDYEKSEENEVKTSENVYRHDFSYDYDWMNSRPFVDAKNMKGAKNQALSMKRDILNSK